MYGLTSKGLNLINESFFLASKYKFILSTYNSCNISVLYVSRIIDKDLLNFYLSPDPTLRFPKFGKGDFRCSDISG